MAGDYCLPNSENPAFISARLLWGIIHSASRHGYKPALILMTVSPSRLSATASLALVALLLSGCESVPVYEQELVSKTGMTRTDSLVEGDRINLLSQIEPGSAVSGGAVAAGCTACR